MQATITFFNHSSRPPTLEIKEPSKESTPVKFVEVDERRIPGEHCWRASFETHAIGNLRFRIQLDFDTYAVPHGRGSFDFYETALRQLWVQDGQVYDYQPVPSQSLSRVVKIPRFFGTLPRRALYVYLPRGYDQHTFKDYPVIYMHDGQNCFESYASDSYAGSWRADELADRLIAAGQMQEVIIVGVSNGGPDRMLEYLPPYTQLRRLPDDRARKAKPLMGRADRTAKYYANEVAPYIEGYYRARGDRHNRATCGSSMGGLLSTYMAWEHADFAQHHAALSPSYWITAHGANGDRRLETVERMRSQTRRDVRIWLDSGTRSSEEHGDDGMNDTIAARDALYENGYVEGTDVRYFLAEGATHSEASWALRLDRVFRFLFPLPAR